MSINALYVSTSTTFTTSAPTTIEQLVGTAADGYKVVPRAVSGSFTVERGLYRYPIQISLTSMRHADHHSEATTGFTIRPLDIKTNPPDPLLGTAATALGMSLDLVWAFFREAGHEAELAPAAATH